MALTKAECKIAWNTIKDLNDYPIQCSTNETQDKFQAVPFIELFSNEIASIDNLINEHFDNPPLRFEELEEDMWVWDTKFVNEHNLFQPTMIYITAVEICRWGGSIIKYPTLQYKTVLKPLFGTFCAIKFEDNRFYRREIQNDYSRKW